MGKFEPATQSQITLLKKLSAGDGDLALDENNIKKLSKQRAGALIKLYLKAEKKKEEQSTFILQKLFILVGYGS